MGIVSSDVIPLSHARANFSELAEEVKAELYRPDRRETAGLLPPVGARAHSPAVDRRGGEGS